MSKSEITWKWRIPLLTVNCKIIKLFNKVGDSTSSHGEMACQKYAFQLWNRKLKKKERWIPVARLQVWQSNEKKTSFNQSPFSKKKKSLEIGKLKLNISTHYQLFKWVSIWSLFQNWTTVGLMTLHQEFCLNHWQTTSKHGGFLIIA